MTRSRDTANIVDLPDNKGDLYASTAADTPARLAVGANGTFLQADSAQTTGIKWSTSPVAGTTSTASSGLGYMGLPQNASTTGSYTVDSPDAGKHIYSTATRTISIPTNSYTALPIGTAVTFIAATGATVTITCGDTMNLAGLGTTGNRTLAPFGMATAVKVASTTWIISGIGLT